MSTFEDDVSIDRFRMISVDRNIIFRDEFASLTIVIGECRFEARLALDGSLRIPEGVHIPTALQERATELGKQAAGAALALAWWGRQRRSGSVRLVRSCEQEEAFLG